MRSSSLLLLRLPPDLSRSLRFLAAACLFASAYLLSTSSIIADEVSLVVDVDRQPLEAGVRRVVQALEIAGSPLPAEDLKAIEQLANNSDDGVVVRALQEALDKHCLAVVNINPESRVKVARGPKQAVLDERGWTNFLVKVHNEAGVTAALECSSPQSLPMLRRSSSAAKPSIDISPADAARRWLDIASVDSQPMTPKLSGLNVEYRILQLYSRDAGKREATLEMHVGQGTQDLGFRSEVPILFECRPSVQVPLVVLDELGNPTTCSLLIKDSRGRVYPNPSRRLAPDFFFHQQVYRNSGESIRLAPGDYRIVAYRGPEYHEVPLELTVVDQESVQPLEIRLKRWIHMAKLGWFSGDHHVHAAGCSHYENPTEGVMPKDMMRHIVGEDLNVGCVLSWGPCWYYQKQFFEGAVSELSRPGYLMRYDVEVSGFPSSHAGHLCLLNLNEDDYPGTESIEQWPTWTLPVLAWGQEQGGVVGYSHSGWGLALPDYLPNGNRGRYPRTWGGASGQAGKAADKLPDYAMPPFDGIGANEFIVTTTAGVCDFISAVDTPAIWELNIWYHTLNCGFTTRISGETDFPCIYGERVGLGRSYVQIDETTSESLQYSDWVQGIKDGRSYVSDGLSHIVDMKLGERRIGTRGESGQASRLDIAEAGKQKLSCSVSAMLPAEITPIGKAIRARRLDAKPYWHLERARIGDTRKVPVEVVVNGHVVATQQIEADGQVKQLEFGLDIQQSSWVALRILPSMHSNPIFVHVADKPIRASRKSADWCREAVDVCWQQKRKQMRPEEVDAAKAAYDKARETYSRIAGEATQD
ncbi:MAG: CehA/McbA family metallohydrolase [Planctomycetota bacterium]